MNGLGFINAGFLALLAGLAVPIILHLMHREVPKPVVFPTIRFILKGSRPQQGKRGLRDLLTLLMRLLVFAAAILLFAQPFLRGEATPEPGRSGRLVLVYDLTPSMARLDWQTFYRQESQRLIDEREPLEIAAIASADGILSTLEPTGDLGALAPFLESLTLSNRPGNHEAALAKAAVFAPGEDSTLVILTDAQRQDWSAAVLPPVAATADLRVVTPPDAPHGNLAVQRVQGEIFGQDDNRRLRAVVQVRNYGLEPRTATLRVRVGDKEVSREVTVRGDYGEKFVLDVENALGTRAVAEIDADDGYPADNAYHFWIGPRPAFRVGALVDPNAGAASVDLFFLRHALETSLPGMATFSVEAMSADRIWEKDLKDYHALALHDAVRDYTEVELEAIRTYAADGGVILNFCGPFAAECLNNLRKNKLTDVRYVGKTGDDSRLKAWFLSKVNQTHPALDVFVDQTSDLTTFPIYQLNRLNVGDNAETLLAIDNTMPFLVRESLGAGVLYTFAAPLNPTWSEFPTALSFLPLVRRLLERNRTDNFGVAEVEVGADATAAIENLGGSAENFQPDAPGVYLAGSTPVEYNFTRLESDHAAEDAYAIRRRLAPADSTAVTDAANPEDAAAGPVRALSPLLAWLLVGALFGELIAANFTKRRQEDPAPDAVA